jgi:hypothetical protein
MCFGKVSTLAEYFKIADYGSLLLKKRARELATLADQKTEELVSGGRIFKYGGIGLTVVGGAVSAYGEYNASHSNMAKPLRRVSQTPR